MSVRGSREEFAENGRDAGTLAIDDETSHTFVRLGIRVRHGKHKVPVSDSTVRDPALGTQTKGRQSRVRTVLRLAAHLRPVENLHRKGGHQLPL